MTRYSESEGARILAQQVAKVRRLLKDPSSAGALVRAAVQPTVRAFGLTCAPVTMQFLASLLVHVVTVSEANRHEHWRKRQARAKAQRAAVCAAWIGSPEIAAPGRDLFSGDFDFPLHVVQTRLASRLLDSDNLASAMKHTRDGIAEALSVTDGPNDPRVTWDVRQEKCGKNLNAVRVDFYQRRP